MTTTPDAFPAVMPHGALRPLFDDVFIVTGTSRPTFMGTAWQFSRNMIVLRDGEALTLVNTVRLDDAGLAQLDALGRVREVLRIGAFHGFDDAFYVSRYGARQWALPGMVHAGERATDVELRPGGAMPLPDASLFVFETAKHPEGILLLDREGGIAITCDSLQNWAEPDEFFSPESATKMREIGFIRPANVGPGWRMASQPQKPDFDRLLELPFVHLLPAHGAPILGDAKERYAQTFAALSFDAPS